MAHSGLELEKLGTCAEIVRAMQVEECVQRHMASLAGELQKILQHVTDELATEVNREQQHLILMQDQA